MEQERVRSDARTRLQEKLRLKRLGLTSEVVDDFLASSDEDVDVTAYKPLTDFNLDDLLSASDSDNDGVGDGVGDGSSDGNKGQDELREKAKIKERIVSPGVDTNISSDDDDNDVVATVANIRMTVMKRRKKKNPNSKQRKILKRAASRRFPKNELGEDESRGAESTHSKPTIKSRSTTVDEDDDGASVPVSSSYVPPRLTKAGSKQQNSSGRKLLSKKDKKSRKLKKTGSKTRNDGPESGIAKVSVRRPSRASLGIPHPWTCGCRSTR